MHDQPIDPAVYPDYEARFLAFLSDALASGRWTIWLVEHEGRIAAHAYVQIIEKVPRPGALDQCFGYVTNVYALPEARNQGVGSRLLAHVIDWAKGQQLEFLILWPSERSVPLYQRIGFAAPADALELILEESD